MRNPYACVCLGVLLMAAGAACAGPPASAASKLNCSGPTNAPHHAYVVVQHLSGSWMERCVGFAGADIDGQALMDQSGIEYKTQSVTSGKVVCQVDLEPRQFTECFPQNQPYWSLFIEESGRWSSAPGGYADIRLQDGGAIGWHYVPPGDAAPVPPPMPA
jgi:hypothetical protein